MRRLGPLYRLYEWHLLREVRRGPLPRHVAVIMDGNRRYAAERGLPREEGYRKGADTTERILDWCGELRIPTLTLFAFSTENFERSSEEKGGLFRLMKEKIEAAARDGRLERDSIRVRTIGRTDLLPPEVREAARRLEEQTRGHTRYDLYVALAYGGRQEIVDTARALARRVEAGELEPDALTADDVARHLYAGPEAASVDLIIRTGGEFRTSNFLPWQAAGNESAAYFCAPYWPEFRKVDFLRAVRTFQRRMAEAPAPGPAARPVHGAAGGHPA
jgi:tritrans,polycis-undecaprenyl-diphosphate synthase [geranylgeranyl-diphosphate specific]